MPRPRPRKRSRQYLIDQLEAFERKPTAAPLVTPAGAISAALTMFVPGPASLVSPKGLGVRLILFALKKTGHKIVAMEREDYERG